MSNGEGNGFIKRFLVVIDDDSNVYIPYGRQGKIRPIGKLCENCLDYLIFLPNRETTLPDPASKTLGTLYPGMEEYLYIVAEIGEYYASQNLAVDAISGLIRNSEALIPIRANSFYCSQCLGNNKDRCPVELSKTGAQKFFVLTLTTGGGYQKPKSD
jgi:hypothetical protein